MILIVGAPWEKSKICVLSVAWSFRNSQIEIISLIFDSISKKKSCYENSTFNTCHSWAVNASEMKFALKNTYGHVSPPFRCIINQPDFFSAASTHWGEGLELDSISRPVLPLLPCSYLENYLEKSNIVE